MITPVRFGASSRETSPSRKPSGTMPGSFSPPDLSVSRRSTNESISTPGPKQKKGIWANFIQSLNNMFIYPGAYSTKIPHGSLKQVQQDPDNYLKSPNPKTSTEEQSEILESSKTALSDLLACGLKEELITSKSQIKHPVWFVPPKDNNKPTILIAKGSRGAKVLGGILDYSLFAKEGYGLAAFEYPGYGITQGTPNPESCNNAFTAVSDFLAQKNTPIEDQIVLAISMGTPIATQNIARAAEEGKHYRALILQSPILSMQQAANNVVNHEAEKKLGNFAFLSKLVPTSLVHTYDTASNIEKVNCPTLFIASNGDFLAPPSDCEKLSAKATNASIKKSVFIDGEHHMDKKDTLPHIHQFLKYIALLKSPNETE